MDNIFTLVKSFKAGKCERIGEYKTPSEAYAAMIKHYKDSAKRGNFSYRITEEEQKIIDGIAFRCYVSGAYSKKYTKEELKTIQ